MIRLQRLIYGLDLITHILLPGYTIALILTAFSTEEYICVAWDSAGVTTGPITVPLVVSMGLGISDALKIKDGFGILACASVSPIISVLATGLWVNGLSNPCGESPTPQITAAADRHAAGVSAARSGATGFPASAIQHVSAPAGGNARSDHEQPVGQPVQPVLKPQASEGVPVSGDATSQLRLAASAGDEAGVAAELARGARVDEADAGGQTALYKAANLGKTAIVKLLVDGGADVNKLNQKVRKFLRECRCIVVVTSRAADNFICLCWSNITTCCVVRHHTELHATDGRRTMRPCRSGEATVGLRCRPHSQEQARQDRPRPYDR